MFNVELAIAVFVFIGLMIAVKEYFVLLDKQKEEDRVENEMALVVLRKKNPNFKVRSTDLDV